MLPERLPTSLQSAACLAGWGGPGCQSSQGVGTYRGHRRARARGARPRPPPMPRPAHRWRDVPRSASRRQHWRLWRRLRRQATTDDGRAGNEGTGRCQWQQRTRHACAATAGEWAARVYFALWLGSCGSRPAGVSLGRLDTRSRFTLLLQRCYVRRRVITRPAPRRSLTSLCTKAEQQCRSSPSPPRGVAVGVDGWSRGKG